MTALGYYQPSDDSEKENHLLLDLGCWWKSETTDNGGTTVPNSGSVQLV